MHCICTRVHNVPKLREVSLSLSLSRRRIAAPGASVVFAQSFMCMQTECVPVYAAGVCAYLCASVCSRATDAAFTCNQALYIPAEELTYRAYYDDAYFAATEHSPLPSSALCLLNEPHAVHLRASTVAKRGSTTFLIGSTFSIKKKGKLYLFRRARE